MANVVDVHMRVEGMTVVLTVEYDDADGIKELRHVLVPPPCESCVDMLTKADVLNMIHTTIGSGGVAH